MRKMEEMSRKKENEKNGEGAKSAPNANVATEKAAALKNGELDAAAKRLSKYGRR